MSCEHCHDLGINLVPQIGLMEKDGRLYPEIYYLLNIILKTNVGLVLCEMHIHPEAFDVASKEFKKEGIDYIPIERMEPVRYCPICGEKVDA